MSCTVRLVSEIPLTTEWPFTARWWLTVQTNGCPPGSAQTTEDMQHGLQVPRKTKLFFHIFFLRVERLNWGYSGCIWMDIQMLLNLMSRHLNVSIHPFTSSSSCGVYCFCCHLLHVFQKDTKVFSGQLTDKISSPCLGLLCDLLLVGHHSYACNFTAISTLPQRELEITAQWSQ